MGINGWGPAPCLLKGTGTGYPQVCCEVDSVLQTWLIIWTIIVPIAMKERKKAGPRDVAGLNTVTQKA